jgi:hypothetical protein
MWNFFKDVFLSKQSYYYVIHFTAANKSFILSNTNVYVLTVSNTC